jgi:hypothetical protein
MKRILSFLLIILVKNAYSATGSASDGDLIPFIVLAIFLLFLGAGYGIDMLKRVFKTVITKIRNQHQKQEENQEINNEYNREEIPLSHVF